LIAAPADDLLARFVGIVGAEHAVTDPLDQQAYLVEWRDRYRGTTPVVLRPGNVSEVAAILALASETGTAIVPQGGNTGLVGGQIPREGRGEIVLSLRRLDRIRAVDPQGNTIDVEAGVTLQQVRDAAASVDRLFPLSLPSQGSCTIGGNIATNAGGTGVLAYGNMRDLVLGLEVVLPDGRVWHGMRHLRKDNTGYDLRNLFVGSEGTLGVVTAAVLKLHPRPLAQATALVGLSGPAAAIDLLALLRSSGGGTVTAFELLPRLGVEFVLRHDAASRDPFPSPHPWYVLAETSSSAPEGIDEAAESVLAQAIEKGLAGDAVIAKSLPQAQALWRLREMLSEIQRLEGGSIKHDVSVPVRAVPELLEKGVALLASMVPGCRPVPFGHLGDGNIHFNVSQPVGADKAAFLARWEEVNRAIHALVVDLGGSISAEHGIGLAKRDLLPAVKDPVELSLMREVKRMLDPTGIMNPGKVVQVQ
jgi:FAD/FMN-containing dehydrogenase